MRATVTRRDVEAAAARLAPYLGPTPLRWSRHHGAFLKLENRQATGSYKVRGALNALASRVEQGDRRPVVAASAGNHARGVAWAAARLGLEAVVVMPEDAPRKKVDGAAALGAEVVTVAGPFERSAELAATLAERLQGELLHPFDDARVIAGQGTVGLEMLDVCPDVVLVPIGGGGLASGVSLALRGSGARVVGVEVRGSDCMARALWGRAPLRQTTPTLADGARVRTPGHLTREICESLLHDVVVVEEHEVRAAVATLAVESGVVAEGAGALAAAALDRVPGRRKVAVVSGGNIDTDVLADVVRSARRAPEGRLFAC